MNNTFPLPFFPTTNLLSSLLPPLPIPGGLGVDEDGQLWSVHSSSYLLLPPPDVFPLLWHGFPWATVLVKEVCSGIVSPWAVVSVLAPGAPSPPALLNPVVSHFFLPPPLPVQYFLPFLEHIFPEAPPVLLMGSAMSCSGSTGAMCMGRPWSLLTGVPPAADTLPWSPNTTGGRRQQHHTSSFCIT